MDSERLHGVILDMCLIIPFRLSRSGRPSLIYKFKLHILGNQQDMLVLICHRCENIVVLPTTVPQTVGICQENP